MENWRLVADSSCDLAPDMFEGPEAGFATVPLRILIGDLEFVDLPSTDPIQMLEAMRHSRGPSSSSCPSPEAFAEEFRKARNCIAVTISSGLSGTYNCALQAMRMVLDDNPDHNIHVVDSRATAGVMVLLLRRLRQLIAQELSFEAVVEQIEHYRNQLRILFSLASFENLVRNGRMSRATGVLASALSIRPVATNSPQGEIVDLEKPRGEKRAIDRMVTLMGEVKDMTGRPAIITHVNNPSAAQAMRAAIEKAYAVSGVTILRSGCLTSFYADDKGLMLSF
jgi:DegV family protein with EDD domain